MICIAGIAPQPLRQPRPRLAGTGRIRFTGGPRRAISERVRQDRRQAEAAAKQREYEDKLKSHPKQ